jgi:AraC-like DNA-binding protein
MTPHHYILTQRVNLAKNEILQGKSLSVAALDAGFSDQSHFARNFKKIYGYAPGELLNKSNFILYM